MSLHIFPVQLDPKSTICFRLRVPEEEGGLVMRVRAETWYLFGSLIVTHISSLRYAMALLIGRTELNGSCSILEV